MYSIEQTGFALATLCCMKRTNFKLKLKLKLKLRCILIPVGYIEPQ